MKFSNRKYGADGHRQRLRQRFARSGRSALADYELLELLLTYGIPRIDTKPIAKRLLDQFGTLLGVLQQSECRLLQVDGIGKQTVLFLKVIHGCLACCMETAVEIQSSILGPEELFAFIRLHLGIRENESVYAIYLDTAGRILHHCDVATGTVNQANVYPREVLKPALIHNATGVVLVHNHPSGQAVASKDDLIITQKLEKIMATVGVTLVDHLIVTRTQAFSIKTGKRI